MCGERKFLHQRTKVPILEPKLYKSVYIILNHFIFCRSRNFYCQKPDNLVAFQTSKKSLKKLFINTHQLDLTESLEPLK